MCTKSGSACSYFTYCLTGRYQDSVISHTWPSLARNCFRSWVEERLEREVEESLHSVIILTDGTALRQPPAAIRHPLSSQTSYCPEFGHQINPLLSTISLIPALDFAYSQSAASKFFHSFLPVPVPEMIPSTNAHIPTNPDQRGSIWVRDRLKIGNKIVVGGSGGGARRG